MLDLLDVCDPSSKLKVTDSDCSDGEYQGETAHLPARLLNGYAEVNYLEDEADVHENQVLCGVHRHLPETDLGQG